MINCNYYPKIVATNNFLWHRLPDVCCLRGGVETGLKQRKIRIDDTEGGEAMLRPSSPHEGAPIDDHVPFFTGVLVTS